MNDLFFELIQVSIGTRICLSHTPSADEWGELYAMAKKQSLVGVCFAGVQKLQTQQQEPPEMLYLIWMGMAAKIQQRNEVVNRQCVELQAKLSADGFKSSILKGQGVASLYKVSDSFNGIQKVSSNLSLLRQSGDIDVWVLPNEGETEEEHIERVVKYAKGFDPESHFSGKHIDLSIFTDPSTCSGEPTEVELHVTPAKMNCPWHERRLKAWFQEQGSKFQVVSQGFRVPTTEFNLVYLLLHCYDHLLFEGVGLRQVMDYYFVLQTSYENDDENENLLKTLSSLGLMKFASAMMWVLGHVFAKEREFMICEPNEKEGRFLLNEIMTGGNFGKYGKDGVMEGHAKGKVAFAIASMKHKMRFLTHYPSEVLWAPYQMLVYYLETIIKRK